ncbi:methionine--tRNA ligase [Patescibacteria group bacterium]|nr:methionine--tRNA ligase [Patescibacteria group bacterium]
MISTKIKTNKEKRRKGKRIITAALPYINNVPHLGHIVGSHLPADIFSRYCRSQGYETLFIGGTDENGSTSEIAAFELNIPLEEFSNRLFKEHKKIYDWLDISYDNFSRTSNKIHHETVKEFFKKIYEKGFIKKGKIKVFYSPKENMFLPDRYVKGECPKCGYKDANGDQCEKCTSLLDPLQLKNPVSSLSGGKLEIKEAEHLFLSLDKLSNNLKKWIESQSLWRDQVKGIAKGWIKEGLKPRCITRDLKHGVKVPLKGFEEKVLYVWFDAPIGYVSSTKEIRKDWEKFWKDKNSEIYNFLGKDNIPFHTIFWPGMIIARGDFNLPKNVVGLQYLNFEGKKFSKSKKVGIFCEKLPEIGLDSDMWRHYLTQIIPETSDSEFKWNDFQNRINSELIGNYSNYVNRVLNFVHSKFYDIIERPKKEDLKEEDLKLIEKITEKKKKIEGLLERAELRKAYSEILDLSSEGNKYINDTQPWVVLKENPSRAKNIFYTAIILLKALTILIAPYLPKTSKRVWNQISLKGSPLSSGIWEEIGKDLGEKHKIRKPEILFEKLTNEQIKKYREVSSQGTELKDFFKD